MGNTNCLAGIKCPKCGSEDRFKIEGKTTFEVTDDGTGDHGDIQWDNESYVECCACGHYGTIKDFCEEEDAPPKPDKLPDPPWVVDVLTKEQKHEYVKVNEGTRCPFCGSDQISGGEWNCDQGSASQEIRCEQCDETWSDVYTLVDVEAYRRKDKSNAETEGRKEGSWGPTFETPDPGAVREIPESGDRAVAREPLL